MRRRKWVLVIAMILLIGIVTPYIIWRVTKANEIIRTRLVEKIKLVLDQGSGIKALSVDLSGLKLEGVVLTPKDSSFSLQVEEVHLGYRLRNLIRYGLKPEKVAHEVSFISPTLILRDIEKPSGSDSTTFSLNAEPGTWEALETIHRITLSQGKILFENKRGRHVEIATQVSGYMHVPVLDSAIVRMNGTFLESEDKNLIIEGVFDVRRIKIKNVYARLHTSKPPKELPMLFPKAMQFADGQMEGIATYNQIEGARGEFVLQNASFVLYDSRLHFHDVGFQVNLNDRLLTLKGHVGGYHGTPFLIEGQVQNPLDPDLNLKLSCESFLYEDFFSHFFPEVQLPVSGDAGINLSCKGSIENPTIRGKIVSRRFRLSKIPVHKLEATVFLKDSLLSIKGLADQTYGSWLKVNAGADFRAFDQGFNVHLETGGNMTPLLPTWLQTQIQEMRGAVQLDAKGWLTRYNGKSTGNFTIISKKAQSVNIQTQIDCRDQKCDVTLTSDQTLRINGSVYHPLTPQVKWDLWAEGLETGFQIFALQPFYQMSRDMDVTGSFSGSLPAWEMTMQGSHQQRKLQVSAVAVQKKTRRELTLKGNYINADGYDLVMESTCSLSPEKLMLHHFSIGDFLLFDGTYPVHNQGQLEGELTLLSVELEQLHPVFPDLAPFKGQLNGKLNIAGTKNAPFIRGMLQLTAGRFHNIGLYEGEMKGKWDIDGLQELSCNIRQNDIPVLTSEVSRTEDLSLKGDITGSNLDLFKTMYAFTGDSIHVSGDGEFRLNVTGPGLHPNVSGHMKLTSGHLGPLEFREIQANIYDVVSDSTGWRGGQFFISNGWLEREDDLTLQFSGAVPHHPDQSIDMRIEARGNLLALLRNNTALVKSALSDGYLNCRIGGRPSNLVIGSGELRIDRGSMTMSHIVDRISNIHVAMQLDPEQSFLQIDSVYGEVDDGSILIKNAHRLSNIQAEPLTLETAGIQLGYLKIKTEGKGLLVRLPGLMQKGDEGYMHFRGKAPQEAFIVAGPASNLRFYGQLHIQEFSITYPFVESNDGPGSLSLDFLKAIDWDLRIVPLKDVHYVRNIQSALGNVFLDLQLREKYGDFNLRGIINEDAFEVWGQLVSNEGSIDVLDYYFRPEQINFDYPRGAEGPILSGRAYTTVIDSLGVPSTVYMTLTTTDNITGIQEEGGPMENVQFRFSTNNPNLGYNEAELLASLGYSGTSMKDRAYDALGVQVENIVFRPILGPIERSVRKYLGLDMFRVSSMLSRNLFELQRTKLPAIDPWWLLRSTKLTVGKYVAPGFFITYAGQIHNDSNYYYAVTGMNLRHALSLEYSIRPDLFLEMEYTYDSMLLSDRRVNRRIWLRHVFPF